MAVKITPSTAPQPECCAQPAYSINETAGTCACLRCGAKFIFDGKAWTKPSPAKAEK